MPSLTMILLTALLCNYGRGKCLIDVGTEGFGGTGSVSYLLKLQGKHVTYNDCLRFNAIAASAFIENHDTHLGHVGVRALQSRISTKYYDDFIERTFPDIYFLPGENRWLDTVAQNIPSIPDRHARAIAYHALFQSCIVKRPYNLFHRKNLYMRTAEVKRGFGNKATWDRPFEDHFSDFVREANDAVFDSGRPCTVLCGDALEVPGEFDLVYVDTPYLNARGVGVDYFEFYHFLEGLADYARWGNRIDYRRKHRPLKGVPSAWSDPKRTHTAFSDLFDRFRKSILVVSYRSDGIPSEEQLLGVLRRVRPRTTAQHYGEYKYVLSTNGSSKEILLIAE